MIVDLFAGPGGWSEGLRMIGLSDVGLEWDEDACSTRSAAGHRTVRCDVTAYPPGAFAGRLSGLIASPPCQAFSMAGSGAGRREIHHLHSAVEACRDGWVEDGREWEDERTPLILEPLRWAWGTRPEWIACEQVPPALPVWQHMADVLRAWGYDATAVKLHSERWGVPQTRERAFLLAHRARVRTPKPTHQRYRKGEAAGEGEDCRPSLFGPGLLPWVSMAEALGWGVAEPYPTLAGGKGNGMQVGGADAQRDLRARIALRSSHHRKEQDGTLARPANAPALTVNSGHSAMEWVRERPSPTIVGTRRSKDGGLVGRQLPPGTGENVGGRDWVHGRPATHVQSTDRIGRPGHKDYEAGESQFEQDAVRIKIHEAAILQGFPPDYPFQGTKTSRFRQVGNAVPPPWAAAIIGALAGIDAAGESAA